MAIGTSGNQFKNAPVAGVLMSELIEYCENGNNHDTEPLTINLKYINKDINLKFYSRNRQINEESSMSVLG
jgi:sarcosine oxidase subunit beta